MAAAEWVEIAKGAVAGVMTALPIIGTLAFFHGKRNERFDRLDKAHTALSTDVAKLDDDFTGLVKQIGAVAHDVEVRFLTRDEHISTVSRLDSNIIELNRNLGQLNTHLFNLARDRHAGVADP